MFQKRYHIVNVESIETDKDLWHCYMDPQKSLGQKNSCKSNSDINHSIRKANFLSLDTS